MLNLDAPIYTEILKIVPHATVSGFRKVHVVEHKHGRKVAVIYSQSWYPALEQWATHYWNYNTKGF